MENNAKPEQVWYLCGPMTGYHKFNIPLFDTVADALRRQGVSVISPPEEDSPTVQKLARASEDGMLADLTGSGESYSEILERCIVTIRERATGLILLPRWEYSKGARLEVCAGLLFGKRFAVYTELTGMVGDDPMRSAEILSTVDVIDRFATAMGHIPEFKP